MASGEVRETHQNPQKLLPLIRCHPLERHTVAEEARKRKAAAAELHALKEKNAASLAPLQAEARDAIAKRDQVRRDLDSANVAAIRAGVRVDQMMISHSQAEAILRQRRVSESVARTTYLRG